MATRRLGRTGLDTKTVHALSARSVNTVRELLELTPQDVSELIDCDLEAADRVLRQVGAACCPEAQTVAALLAKRASEAHHLATGLPALDAALRGGAPCGGITELVGPAGAGKTQLCSQLCVQAQLPVLLGGMGLCAVVYVDTEQRFSAARLVELATARWPARFADAAAITALTRSVVVYSPTSTTELVARLDALEATIIERGAKLVIIDSIAALLRAEFGRDQVTERQALLGLQASRLKLLAEAFRIPIVVTNQVQALRPAEGRAVFERHTHAGGGALAEARPGIGAALGTKWAHDVNTRLALERTAAGERLITIRKSPAAPFVSFPFEVGQTGLTLVGEARDMGSAAAWEGDGLAFFSA